MDILVFRTTLKNEKDIKNISKILNHHKQVISWHVDLEDWEKILRLEVTKERFKNEISARIRGLGYQCQELED
ncbi:hypothetical protein [Flagellimonas beolgyonensis]|uniref:hypothetical protein n=1 Tax=Flagellimonas beolgyonensis TaxID=864064 RepID=UPI003D658438